jgi:hypothetical protein
MRCPSSHFPGDLVPRSRSALPGVSKESREKAGSHRGALMLIALGLALLRALMPSTASAAPDTPGIYLPVVFSNYTTSGPSSFTLIGDAVARGEIDPETGLIFEMYAVFDDPRLPAQYRGNNSGVREAPAQSRIANEWNALKPSTRDALLPFMIPPIYAGSWFDLRYGEAAAAGTGGSGIQPAETPSPLICNHSAKGWNSFLTKNGKARVWWNSKWPADKARAEAVMQNLDGRIWAALVEIHGAPHQPLSDQGAKCGGPDGAIDIFITPLTVSGYFMPLPDYWTWPDKPCPARAGQLQLANDESGSTATAGLIHELMHAFNNSYQHTLACAEFDWLDESTANWAIDYVEPKNNDEHNYAGLFLGTPNDPLETTANERAYGAYLFPFYLNRYRGGHQQIGQIWAATTTQNSLAAVDGVVQGRFQKAWPDFVLHNWNTPPVDKYRKDDGLPDQADAYYPPELSKITMQGQGQWQKAVASSEINHLGARYFHFTFNDPTVRSVGWYNGITANLRQQAYYPGPGLPYHGETFFAGNPSDAEKKGAHVWAIYKIAGRATWEQPEDWTDRIFSGFCRDMTSERITDLVLIYSNSEWQDRAYKLDAPGLEPQLFMSNIGCWRWEGKATYQKTDMGTLVTKIEVDVAWERHSFGGQYPLPTFFRLASATGKWTVSGSLGDCTASATGPFVVDPADEPQMTIYDRIISGPALRAYSGRGQTNQTITYTMQCPKTSYQYTDVIGVWWEPPTGLEPETAFKSVKSDGVTIMDEETRTESFGARTITETRNLKARSQP